MKYLGKEIHVCNLFSNGQEEKNGVTYRDKANVAKCIQRIHSDREYMSTGSSHL